MPRLVGSQSVRTARAQCDAVHTGTDRRLRDIQNTDPEAATGEHGTGDLANLDGCAESARIGDLGHSNRLKLSALNTLRAGHP